MKTLILIIFSGLTAVVPAQAFLQEIPLKDKAIADQQAASIFRALREVTKPVGEMVFPVYSYRRKIGYAVSLGEGKLLAKWSELAQSPGLSVTTKKGERVEVVPIGVYPEHDLVLIKAEGLDAPAVKWADGSKLAPGAFLAAVDEDGEAQAMGVVSVPARSLRDEDQGFLGISISRGELSEGVFVSGIVRNSAAHRAGIRGGDVVTKINGEKVKGFFELSSRLRRLKAGKQAEIEVLRDGEILNFRPLLDAWRERDDESDRLQSMDQMSGTQSRVRDEFPNVMQSDMELEAYHNGMAIVDMRGRVVGLVIARAGRISTLILPGELIAKELKTNPEPVAMKERVPRGIFGR